MKKLQHDFAELKLKVEYPAVDSKNNKRDERNIKLDDFTDQGSPEEYLDWERQVDKTADVKELDNKQAFKLAYLGSPNTLVYGLLV